MDEQELIDMADMYASTCTRQEEKFTTWQRWGCPWRWLDCDAAFSLCMERADRGALPERALRRRARVESGLLFRVLSDFYKWTPTEAYHWDMGHR